MSISCAGLDNCSTKCDTLFNTIIMLDSSCFKTNWSK